MFDIIIVALVILIPVWLIGGAVGVVFACIWDLRGRRYRPEADADFLWKESRPWVP